MVSRDAAVSRSQEAKARLWGGKWTARQILDAISGLESGGNYTAKSKTSSASGKYQWIRSTWNNYAGYAEAWMAPPAVQEARAVQDIEAKLKAYGGDVRKAIMSWFLPAAVNNPALANKVPKANVITPNQYADKVMARLGKATGASYSGETEADVSTANTGGNVEVAEGEMPATGPDLHDVNVQLANLYTLFMMPNDQRTSSIETGF